MNSPPAGPRCTDRIERDAIRENTENSMSTQKSIQTLKEIPMYDQSKLSELIRCAAGCALHELFLEGAFDTVMLRPPG